ncbi:MAG TPA: hypothetical protein PKX81_07190, partial [Gemmiger formicilis]|nr:hypothetical protein [Gemmiger formicilis]
MTYQRVHPLLLKFYQKSILFARGQATKNRKISVKSRDFPAEWMQYLLRRGGISGLQGRMPASARGSMQALPPTSSMNNGVATINTNQTISA